MSAQAAEQPRRPRDLRLDFFRGLAMFIILLAHTSADTWTLWIPARFGFSDATEIFVFCSGMASALAFGTVFAKRSWFLGTARILFRVWQVYWAHIGVFLATAMVLALVDSQGLGVGDKVYSKWASVSPLFERTRETLLGLMTLGYVPGLFDILPMYLVILAMVPVVMGVARLAGPKAAMTGLVLLYLATQFAEFARTTDPAEVGRMGAGAIWLGAKLDFLLLSKIPWRDGDAWFFNPFGWQLVFFTGFAFGVGWLRPPPVTPLLLMIAGGIVVLTLPFAWFQLHGGSWPGGRYLPLEWGLTEVIRDVRAFIKPLYLKTPFGLLRWIHFLAVAYLFWAAVGPGGWRLREGWRAGASLHRGRWLIAAGLAMLATFPYAFHWELRGFAPETFIWIMSIWPEVPDNRMGALMLVFLAAFLIALWHGPSVEWRQFIVGRGFLKTVPVIRKVGTQSLAVFMVSIVLSRIDTILIEHIRHWAETTLELGWEGVRSVLGWGRFAVHGFGFSVLIATAYLVGWFKGQPWRKPAPAAAPASPAADPARA